MAYGEHGAEHGPSFADALLGVELAAGYTGHSVSLADATTAAIVIQSVFGHDGGFPPHAGAAAVPDIPAPTGRGFREVDGGYPGPRKDGSLSLPGPASHATPVRIVWAPHAGGGPAPAVTVRSLAEATGLEPCVPSQPPTCISNLLAFDRMESKLVGHPGQQPPAADGSAAPGPGTTRIWRQFYRIPLSRFVLFRMRATLDNCRTFLVVTGVTWHDTKLDEYETRVVFTVYSLPFVFGGGWTYADEQIEALRRRAEDLSRRLERQLAEYPRRPRRAR